MLRQRRTIRLALTYLMIMMVLSIGFSVLFFYTSAGSLSMNIQHAPSQEAIGTRIGNLNTVDGTNIPTSPDTDPNKELTTRLSAVQQDLARRLVLLNIGVFLAGGLLSYYLARRTLQPIEQSMERQARFSSDASHELRTPLTALRTRAEVALRNPSLTLVEAKDALKNSVEQAVQLEHLAEALLRLSQDDSPLALKPVRVKEVLDKATERLEQTARAKQIKLHQDVSPTLTVLAEADSLVQITSILLDNAIKYSPPASTITISAQKNGSKALIGIQDRGIGISQADLPHIFERFYRADQARRHQEGHSYGLGLAIAGQLVERNKGLITVSSKPGKGSLFTVTLPIA